jgi:hypothetical protein
MPGPVQLAELVTRVRRRADMENSLFCTDAEIQEYVEQSLGDLFDLIIENNGTRHWISQTDVIETSAGVAAYTNLELLPQLPAPIYKLIGVDVKWNGEWVKIKPGLTGNWNRAEATTGWQSPGDIEYWFYQSAYLTDVLEPTQLEQVIRFAPTPQGTHEFRLRFVPYPNDWSSAPTRYFQGYSGWDEYIVCDAAAKCLEKEESFEHAERLMRRRDQAGDRIRWHAQTMNEDGQGRIRDLEEEEVWYLR